MYLNMYKWGRIHYQVIVCYSWHAYGWWCLPPWQGQYVGFGLCHRGLCRRVRAPSPRTGEFHATVPKGKLPIFLGLFEVIFYFPNGKSTMTGESIKWIFLNFGRTPKQQIQVLLEDSLWDSVAGKLMRYFSHFDTCFDAHMDKQHVLARTRRTSWTKLPGVCNSLLVKITMFYVFFSNMFYGHSSNCPWLSISIGIFFKEIILQNCLFVCVLLGQNVRIDAPDTDFVSIPAACSSNGAPTCSHRAMVNINMIWLYTWWLGIPKIPLWRWVKSHRIHPLLHESKPAVQLSSTIWSKMAGQSPIYQCVPH